MRHDDGKDVETMLPNKKSVALPPFDTCIFTSAKIGFAKFCKAC